MDKPATGSAHLGIVISLGAVAIVAYALSLPAHFAETTHRWPFPMGFAKLFFLGTFGELIKFRFAKGNWRLDRLLHRAAVWGVFGLWFTLAFAGFSALVDGVVRAGLWPADVAVVPAGLWLAFSKSLWINLLGMFGWGMMVVHEYCNHLIRTNWRGWSLAGFATNADTHFLLAYLPKTLLFWIPAHTFTFAMPADWRVFIAAMLAVVLGFLLSVGRRS